MLNVYDSFSIQVVSDRLVLLMTKLEFKVLILIAFLMLFDPAMAHRKDVISSGQARKMAEERFGGQALSATFVEAGNASVYRVKLIKGGRVRIVTIPAKP